MYLKYGSFTHPLGEAAVFISREPVETEASTRYAIRERWDIQGLICNPTGTATAMSTLIAALETAYATDGNDLTLYLPDGITSSQHAIDSSTTIGGTRIVQPLSYPEGEGPEYITMRHFTVAVEALKPVSGPTNLLSFSESVTYIGGGPRYGHLEPLAGPPVKQLLKNMTIYKATQRGNAVGLYAYPIVPSSMWPAYQLQLPDISYGSPRRIGYNGATNHTEFPVEWTYEFESAQSLSGSPHTWNQ